MRIGFIATVLNEEKAITAFLNSLLNQSQLPFEIIIVDGGSKDETLNVLKDYKKLFAKKSKKILYKIIVKNGNRSVGRNYAIRQTKADVVVASDAGCILKKDWIAQITKAFEKKGVDVIAGFYKPITKNAFEQCLSTYTCVMEDKVTNNFLPSSRSVAFRKSAWEKVKGYPEDLDTCEDLVFARNMRRKELKFSVNKKAIVYWQQKKNILEACIQFYSYAKGDGRAGYIRRQTPLLYLRFGIGLILLFYLLVTKNILLFFTTTTLFLLYAAWAVFKNYRYVNNLKALFYLPLLQIVSDFAVVIGMTIGFISRFT